MHMMKTVEEQFVLIWLYIHFYVKHCLFVHCTLQLYIPY